MAGFFNLILAKISAALGWIGDLFKAVFVAAWDMLTDLFCWIFDQVMGVAVGAVASLDVSGITASVGAWGELSAEVINALLLLRVPEAIGIIGVAIGIRLVLQLIPFTRLGS